MQWTDDARGSLFTLEDGGARLAFVSIRERAAPVRRFRVKSAISFMYFGAARQSRLERARKQWVVQTRGFRDRPAAERYAAVKRAQIEAFVRRREAGQ